MKTIYIEEETLPIAWEKAVIETWEKGDSFPTQYDKPGDANSKDVTATIHVKNPFAEPRIHRCFPGGLDDLEKYTLEVLYGVHDHWIDPKNGKWEYTYHKRLFEYEVPCDCGGNPLYGDLMAGSQLCPKCQNSGKMKIDQIEKCIDALKKCWFTRRAQAITWMPWEDMGISDPSCLQRLWLRIQEDDQGVKRLHMNINIRSNDAFKAGFMNMYAFTELQRMIAGCLGVELGSYTHVADSFHIYGSYFDAFKSFLETVKSRPESERVYTTEFANDFFIDGCDQLLAEKDMPNMKKSIISTVKKSLEDKVR